jgi:hypothetical protein
METSNELTTKTPDQKFCSDCGKIIKENGYE